MGHDHEHDHSHDNHGHGSLGHHHHFHASQSITRAMVVTLIFMAVEFVGGYYSNSLALISDAAHMLTDVGALLLSLFALWIARKPVTLTMSFGYHRAEILGA